MKLDERHVRLLRRLIALPLSGRMKQGSVPDLVKELEVTGYVRLVPVGLSQQLAEVTDGGRKALAAPLRRLCDDQSLVRTARRSFDVAFDNAGPRWSYSGLCAATK